MIRSNKLVVIWCSLKMGNNRLPLLLDSHDVVIWCSLKMGNNLNRLSLRESLLWFDALWKWETMAVRMAKLGKGCDLMLFENGKQLYNLLEEYQGCCDLMLFENGKQFMHRQRQLSLCCDLMLFENGKQSCSTSKTRLLVVIWCSLKMGNND